MNTSATSLVHAFSPTVGHALPKQATGKNAGSKKTKKVHMTPEQIAAVSLLAVVVVAGIFVGLAAGGVFNATTAPAALPSPSPLPPFSVSS
jgi:hypothetical protein